MTTGRRFAKWGCGSGNGSPQEVRDAQVVGRFVPLLFDGFFRSDFAHGCSISAAPNAQRCADLVNRCLMDCPNGTHGSDHCRRV